MTGYRAGRMEELITLWPLAETVDCEHVAFAGRDPEWLSAAVAASDVERVDWFRPSQFRDSSLRG